MIETKIIVKPKGNSGTGNSSGASGYGGEYVPEADYAARAGKAKKAESADLAMRANTANTADRAKYADKAGELDEEAEVLQRYIRKDIDDIAQGTVTWEKVQKLVSGLLVGNFNNENGGSWTPDAEGRSHLITDYLEVRMKAIFEELVIKKTSTIGGKEIISPAGGVVAHKVEEVTVTYNNVSQKAYRCYFLAEQDGDEVDNDFAVNDQVRSESFNVRKGTYHKVGNHFYWRLVIGRDEDPVELEGKKYHYIDLSDTDCATASDVPAKGDVLNQCGNRTDVERQNCLIFSAVDTYSPSISLYHGINSYSFANKEYVEYGVNKQTNKAFFNVYGDMYVGDRPTKENGYEGSSYVKYDSATKQVSIKGKLSAKSTVDGKELSQYIKENSAKGLTEEQVNNLIKNSQVIADLQNQVDGAIETWFYEGMPTLTNAPASSWTTDKDKDTHLGDLYYDNKTGKAYRFAKDGSIYKWTIITDTDIAKALSDASKAQETADGKMKVFSAQPTPPYQLGDIWVNATYPSDGSTYKNEVLRCQTKKAAGSSFAIGDWIKASKYTDDTVANAAKKAAEDAQKAAYTAQTNVTNLGKTVTSNKKAFDSYVTDGYLEPSEIAAMAQDSKRLEDAFAAAEKSYTEVKGAEVLKSTKELTALNTAFATLTTAKTELVTYLSDISARYNAADTEGKATIVSAVGTKFTNFQSAYSAFYDKLGLANAYITSKIYGDLKQNITDLAGYKYIKDALGQTTDIDGGLVMTTLIALRDADGNVQSGINGAIDPNRGKKSIATWWGGQMVDKDYNSGNLTPATSLIRFDGSGYLANGAIWWDVDGKVHADPTSFIISEKNLGAYLTFFEPTWKTESAGTSVADLVSLKPNAPFSKLGVSGDATFEGAITFHGIKLTYDATNKAIKVDGNLYATGGITAYGAGTSTSTGGGLNGSVKSYADSLKLTSESLSEIASAYSIKQLSTRITSLEGGSATSISVSGGGNAVTSVTKNGTTISVVKGGTFLTSHQSLSAYLKSADAANTYLKLSGGTMTGVITKNNGTSTIKGRDGAIIRQNYAPNDSSWNTIACVKTRNGAWTLGHLTVPNKYDTSFAFCYTTDANYDTNNNDADFVFLRDIGGTIALTSEIPTNNNQLTNGAGYITSAGSCRYATSAGSANSVAWSNVIGRPTNVSQFTNDSGYITSSASITGNAATATKLQTARKLWGNSFNGTADINGSIIVPSGKYISIGNIKMEYDATNKALKITNTTTNEVANLYTSGGVSAYGVGTSSSSGGGLNGSVKSYADALKLTSESLSEIASAYSIKALASRISSLEGGSATSISVSGSGNAVTSVTKNGTTISVVKGGTFLTSHQSLSAYLKSADAANTYLKLSGGTMTGVITKNNGTSTIKGRDGAIIRQNYAPNDSSWNTIACVKTRNGAWTLGHLTVPNKYDTSFAFCYTTDANYDTNNNDADFVFLRDIGGTIALTSEIPTNNNQLTNGAGYITSAGSCRYATSAGSANSVAWSNVIGRPTNVSQFTNDSGYITSSASITGNAATATKLQTARKLWGNSFNGTADINGSIIVPSGKYISIGNIKMEYDATNKALKITNTTTNEVANLYTSGGVSSYGVGTSTSTGGGLNGSVKSYSDALKLTSESLSEIASAYSIKTLDSRIVSLEGGSAMDVSVSGSGNAVTAISKSGTTISVTKGITFLTSHQSLDGYVNEVATSGTGNAITSVSKSGKKLTFTKGVTFLTSHQSLEGYATKSWVDSKGYLTSHQDISGKVNKNGDTISGILKFTNVISNKGTIDIDFNYNAGGFARDIISLNNSVDSGDKYHIASIGVLCYPHQTSNRFQFIYIGSGDFSSENNLRIYKDKVTFGSNTIIDSGSIGSQSVKYAASAGSTNSVAWSNVIGRPTNVSQFINDSGYITSSASITGNAATATKLQTARTIWGQSFNGTANVSGNLTGVDNITMSNNSYIYGKNTSGTAIQLIAMASWNSVDIGRGALTNGYTTQVMGKTVVLTASDDSGKNVKSVELSTAKLYSNVNIETEGGLLAHGGVTAYSSSDIRLKQDLRKLDYLGIIKAMGGTFGFAWKKDNTRSIGFIAQHVLCNPHLKDIVETDEKGYYKINYWSPKLIATAFGAIEQVGDEVSRLKARVVFLESEVQRLSGKQDSSDKKRLDNNNINLLN